MNFSKLIDVSLIDVSIYPPPPPPLEDVKERYEKLLKIFQSEESNNLKYTKLKIVIEKMLLEEDEELLKYTISNAKKDETYFDIVYNDFKNNKMRFEKIDCPYTNLALCWLYYKYH